MNTTDTPTAPPAHPVIPLGITSQVLLGTMSLSTAVGVVYGFLNGDHSMETIGAFIVGITTLVTWAAGRFAQATALYRDAPSPLQGATAVLEYATSTVGEWTPTGKSEGAPASDDPSAPVGLGGGQQ